MKTICEVTLLLTTFHCGCSFATPVSSGKSPLSLTGHDTFPPRPGSLSSTQDLLHDHYFHNVLMETSPSYSSANQSNERASTSNFPNPLYMKDEVGSLRGIDSKAQRLTHALQEEIQKVKYEERSSGNHHKDLTRMQLAPSRAPNERERIPNSIEESPLPLTLIDMVHNHSKLVNNFRHIRTSQLSESLLLASRNPDQENDNEKAKTELQFALHKQLEKDFVTKGEHQKAIKQSRKAGWNGKRPESFETNLNRLAWKKSKLFHFLTKGIDAEYKSHIAEHYVPRAYHEDYIKLLNSSKDVLPAVNAKKAMPKKRKVAKEESNLATTMMHQPPKHSSVVEHSDHQAPGRISSRSNVSTDLTLGRPSEEQR